MPFNKIIFGTIIILGLAACGHVDEYERQVYDHEPVYCYKSLAGTSCYREPKHSDERRLVNYFGPHPSRYEKPEPAPSPALQAPEMVNYWVKDPEPIPRPMAKGDLDDRPWLTEEGQQASEDRQQMRALAAEKSGTRAFLRHLSDNAAAPAKQEADGGETENNGS